MIDTKPSFLPIDFVRDMETCVRFREDSFRSSYPDSDEWQQHWDEADYRQWIPQHAARFPGGAQHLWSDGEIIGQLEFAYQDDWGHVNLFYLREDKRGLGYGTLLQEYVTNFLRLKGCRSATLRAGPRNKRAIRFYEKHGWRDTGPDTRYPQVHLYRLEF